MPVLSLWGAFLALVTIGISMSSTAGQTVLLYRIFVPQLMILLVCLILIEARLSGFDRLIAVYPISCTVLLLACAAAGVVWITLFSLSMVLLIPIGRAMFGPAIVPWLTEAVVQSLPASLIGVAVGIALARATSGRPWLGLGAAATIATLPLAAAWLQPESGSLLHWISKLALGKMPLSILFTLSAVISLSLGVDMVVVSRRRTSRSRSRLRRTNWPVAGLAVAVVALSPGFPVDDASLEGPLRATIDSSPATVTVDVGGSFVVRTPLLEAATVELVTPEGLRIGGGWLVADGNASQAVVNVHSTGARLTAPAMLLVSGADEAALSTQVVVRPAPRGEWLGGGLILALAVATAPVAVRHLSNMRST